MSPTSHRPLHESSPPWILFRLHFCRCHRDCLAALMQDCEVFDDWDCLAPIYSSVETSQSSKTLQSCIKAHAPYAPSLTSADITRDVIRAKSILAYISIHSSTDVIATSSCWLLTALTLTVDFCLWPGRWLFSKVDFCNPGSPYLVFCIDFIFAVCFCILCL